MSVKGGSYTVDPYLPKAGLPKLSPQARDSMNDPIATELSKGIQGRPTEKTPGPDGISLYYYKTFKQSLSTWFLRA